MLIVNLTMLCLRYAWNSKNIILWNCNISFTIFYQALHIWVIVTSYFNFCYITSMSFFVLYDVSFASWLWNFYFIYIFLYFHKIHTFLSTTVVFFTPENQNFAKNFNLEFHTKFFWSTLTPKNFFIPRKVQKTMKCHSQ